MQSSFSAQSKHVSSGSTSFQAFMQNTHPSAILLFSIRVRYFLHFGVFIVPASPPNSRRGMCLLHSSIRRRAFQATVRRSPSQSRRPGQGELQDALWRSSASPFPTLFDLIFERNDSPKSVKSFCSIPIKKTAFINPTILDFQIYEWRKEFRKSYHVIMVFIPTLLCGFEVFFEPVVAFIIFASSILFDALGVIPTSVPSLLNNVLMK